MIVINHKRTKPQRNDGFTLIELLITIGLMSFIMLVVSTIFTQTSTTYTTSIDRMNIYSSIRPAIDMMVTDINGCFSLETGQQRFSMGEDKTGEQITDARDRISFRSIALVKQQIRSAQIEYSLVEDTDPNILDEKGKAGVSKTTKTKRQLYVLRRIAKDFDGTLLDSTDLCHCVLYFNIEVFDTTSRSFKQLDEVSYNYPIGDKQPEDEKIPTGLRVSLRVVANAAERQERIFIRSIWIPIGE